MARTRDRMLEAARDLILDGGLASFSMRKVASACGVSATAIYRHYDSKDDLLSEAVRAGYRIFAAFLMDALKGRDSLDRFRRAMQRYYDFAHEHPRYYALMFMTNCDELGLEQLDQRGQEELSSTFQFLMDRIAECQRDGVFRDGPPLQLAAGAWATLHGLASLRLTKSMDVDDATYNMLVAQQLELVERSLRAELRPSQRPTVRPRKAASTT